jgi:hypothetical protein
MYADTGIPQGPAGNAIRRDVGDQMRTAQSAEREFIRRRLDFKASIAPVLPQVADTNEVCRGTINSMNPDQVRVFFDAAVTHVGLIVFGRAHDEHLREKEGQMFDPVVDGLRRRFKNAGTSTDEQALAQISMAESLAQVATAVLSRTGKLPTTI